MVKRKVSLIGPSTLMVSLPSKWVKEFGVRKGDEVEVNTSGKNLVIETSGLKKGEVLDLDLSGSNANLIRYVLYSAYRSGSNEIKVKFEDEKVIDNNTGKKVFVLDVIADIVDSVVGIEIMVQKKDYVLIKEISTLNHEEFMNTLSRIFITLVNTSSDIKDAIEEKNKIILERILKMTDKKINRFCDFCFRVINKGGVVESKKSPQYYSIISALEEIGDVLKNICSLALQKEIKVSLIKDVNELLENIYRLFCEYKKEKLVEIYSLKDKIKQLKIEGDIKREICGLSEGCSKIMSEIISLNMLEK
jgi:phosphate uptake regulator